jgi:hypothetical protein
VPPKPYHKKWLSISETLASLTGNSNAKAAICNAIADARFHLSFLVPQLDAVPLLSARIRFELTDAEDGTGAKSLAGIPVRIPGRLPVERFADLAQPIRWWWPWFFGAVSQRPDLAGFYWALAELELLAADVKKVLGGAPPVLISEWQEQERAAIEWLASEFRKRGESIKLADAQNACCQQFDVTKGAVRYRIWPEARDQAGLPQRAPPGAKRKATLSAVLPSEEIAQKNSSRELSKKSSKKKNSS